MLMWSSLSFLPRTQEERNKLYKSRVFLFNDYRYAVSLFFVLLYISDGRWHWPVSQSVSCRKWAAWYTQVPRLLDLFEAVKTGELIPPPSVSNVADKPSIVLRWSKSALVLSLSLYAPETSVKSVSTSSDLPCRMPWSCSCIVIRVDRFVHI